MYGISRDLRLGSFSNHSSSRPAPRTSAGTSASGSAWRLIVGPPVISGNKPCVGVYREEAYDLVAVYSVFPQEYGGTLISCRKLVLKTFAGLCNHS